MAGPSTIVVRCPHCGTKNRIDTVKAAGAKPRCAKCHEHLEVPSRQQGPLQVNSATFPQLVERSPIPVLLEFSSPYCVYCQQMKPLVDRLARDISDRVRVAVLNIDENPAIAARYRIEGTPTTLILDQGREKERLPGLLTEDQLRYRLYRYLS